MTGLGIITAYFSDPFVSGYTCGSAIHATLSQTKELLGIKNTKRFSGAFKVPRTIYDYVINLSSINYVTLIISTICIVYLMVFKELINPRIKKCVRYEFPSELLLVSRC